MLNVQKYIKKHLNCFFILLLINIYSYAIADITSDEMRRSEDRQRYLEEVLQPKREVSLTPKEAKKKTYPITKNEEVCFPINRIDLEGEGSQYFISSLNTILDKSNYEEGDCLGGNAINEIMTYLQNDIISRGYTTTRVLVAPQDLRKRTLILTILVGKVRSIVMDSESEAYQQVLKNAFPLKEGDNLDLHAIEQGLENLKRVPTADANMQIIPTESIDESDIVVSWKQRSFPYRISLSIDDSGSRQTGKYQGTITFSRDNPLGLNDLFYASYSHDLGHAKKIEDNGFGNGGSGTKGYALHYSIPYGYWLFSLNKTQNRYHQTIAGINENYIYSGRSNNFDLTLSRTLYRDAKRKTTLSGQYWFRTSRNYINDAEIEVQQRRMGGWSLGIDHREYIKNMTLDIGLNYKRGTGVNNAMSAPEEAFSEGTSRPKIITLDLNLFAPFKLGENQWSYTGKFKMQKNRTPLVSQDMFSIGNRYTVRGFDGEMTLMAERGFYLQNTFAWHYRGGHQFYLGADIGRVSGPSAQHLVGHTLMGGVVGLKGQFSDRGSLYYDVFVGTPIRKPKHFKTSNQTLNFNLSYTF